MITEGKIPFYMISDSMAIKYFLLFYFEYLAIFLIFEQF